MDGDVVLSLDGIEDWNHVQDLMDMGFWEWDIPRDTVRWSPTLFTLFAIDPGDVQDLGFETFLDVVDPEDRGPVRSSVEDALETGSFEPFEFRVPRPDGSTAWFASRGEVVLDEAGNRIRMTGTVHDITERKRLERALAAQNVRLQEAQQIAEVGHWEWDARTEQHTGSVQMTRLLGFETGEPYEVDRLLERVHPKDREAAKGAMDRTLSTGEPTTVDYRYEHPDGSMRWLESRLTPKREEGEVVGIRGTVQDVTERKQLIEELEAAKRAAEEADRAKSMFLANVSHEVRTPMTAILGLSNLLLERDLDAGVREDLETIQVSGEHLLSILDDILDLSKIEAGELEVVEEPFDLRRCVEGVLEMLAYRAAEKDIDLVYHMEDGVPEAVVGDRDRVRQVLANLVSNAVKFTEEGGVTVTVEPDPEGGSQLAFHVEDTGIGISDEDQRKLFTPFQQVDPSSTRSHEGTGLGLAISKQLVELMDGSIGLQSTPGEGSTFTVRLPLEPAETSPDRAWKVAPDAFRGTRVLVVDDNATNRDILARNLDAWEMPATTTATPEEALSLLGEGSFGLVITDFQMPGMDGAELARRIAEEVPNPPPVVMLTSMPRLASERASDHVEDILDKPVRPSELFDAIGRALGVHTEGQTPEARFDAELAARHPLDILLVEDSETNRMVQRRIMARLGYDDVEVAVHGRKALDRFEEGQRFDLVFMDVQMPEMDGFKATREIRALVPEDEQPCIVALTAHASREDRKRCLEAGMDGYLAKPVDLDALVEVLETVVEPAEA